MTRTSDMIDEARILDDKIRGFLYSPDNTNDHVSSRYMKPLLNKLADPQKTTLKKRLDTLQKIDYSITKFKELQGAINELRFETKAEELPNRVKKVEATSQAFCSSFHSLPKRIGLWFLSLAHSLVVALLTFTRPSLEKSNLHLNSFFAEGSFNKAFKGALTNASVDINRDIEWARERLQPQAPQLRSS